MKYTLTLVQLLVQFGVRDTISTSPIDSNGNFIGKPYSPLAALNKERIYSFYHSAIGRTYILTDKRIILWNESQNTFKTLSTKIDFSDFAYRSFFTLFNIIISNIS